MDEYKRLIAKLKALLDDPQPGLAAWSCMWGETMKQLSDLWHGFDAYAEAERLRGLMSDVCDDWETAHQHPGEIKWKPEDLIAHYRAEANKEDPKHEREASVAVREAAGGVHGIPADPAPH